MQTLKKFAKKIEKLAENPDTEYPTEITYLPTPPGTASAIWVTKTEERVVNDADEAMSVRPQH